MHHFFPIIYSLWAFLGAAERLINTYVASNELDASPMEGGSG